MPEMSAAEYDDFKRQLWSAPSPAMPATILPNGSRFDYDRQLGATVETRADGARYIVRLGEMGLVRFVELQSAATSAELANQNSGAKFGPRIYLALLCAMLVNVIVYATVSRLPLPFGLVLLGISAAILVLFYFSKHASSSRQ